jgi:16S rRNA (cytosine967-C5)-methyltransferase
VLVYADCSLLPPEGPEQIDALLGRHDGIGRLPIVESELGGLPALLSADGDLRTLPSMLAEDGGLDGFFIARLTRH